MTAALTLTIRGLVSMESLTTPTLGDDMVPVRRKTKLYLNSICDAPQ